MSGNAGAKPRIDSPAKVILVIMDGWGIATDKNVSAVDKAHTPFYDTALQQRPHARLMASEEPVGLPKSQMGNSEVGHMNIGAGRVVYQDLVRISLQIEQGAFAQNAEYRALLNYCNENQKPLHLMGLLSDGGVHSHIDHLLGILGLLSQEKNTPPVYLHMFMDGRDTAPDGGADYLQQVEDKIQECGVGKIATLIGRYYSMDRNNQYDRIAEAYNLIVHGKGASYPNAAAAITDQYAQGKSDEFLPACVITESDQAIAKLQDGDGVLFFNFRTDRGRQLSNALTQSDMPEVGMHKLKLHYNTMTRYDDSFEGVNVLYDKDDIQMGLGETLALAGKNQIRIAETEKYPHVTFFFNGGREKPFEGETRILCPSPSVATYDLKPEMSALEIRDKIVAQLHAGTPDFVCLNFANPDMVGHTGDFDAAIKACEVVDGCTRDVVNAALANGYVALVTADHGNADKLLNPDGSKHTAHTTALVPLLLFDPQEDAGKRKLQLRDGKLGDLAPTILHLMGLDIPEAMTGEVLVNT